MCLQAVKQNGEALQFVPEQTFEYCLEAVKNTPVAMNYIKDRELKEAVAYAINLQNKNEIMQRQITGRSAVGNSNKIDISRKQPIHKSDYIQE